MKTLSIPSRTGVARPQHVLKPRSRSDYPNVSVIHLGGSRWRQLWRLLGIRR
jgi:hypothetical protein